VAAGRERRLPSTAASGAIAARALSGSRGRSRPRGRGRGHCGTVIVTANRPPPRRSRRSRRDRVIGRRCPPWRRAAGRGRRSRRTAAPRCARCAAPHRHPAVADAHHEPPTTPTVRTRGRSGRSLAEDGGVPDGDLAAAHDTDVGRRASGLQEHRLRHPAPASARPRPRRPVPTDRQERSAAHLVGAPSHRRRSASPSGERSHSPW